MIHSFTCQGFKALDDLRVALEPFTLFVGPNGCGKSSVLEGIHFLCQLAGRPTTDPGGLFAGPSAPRRLCFPGRESFVLGAATANGSFRVTIGTGPTPSGLVASKFEGSDDAGQWVELSASTLPRFAGLSSVARLRLDPEQAKMPSARQAGRSADLESDGAGLATVIADALGRRDEMIGRIEDDLAKVVPAARGIRAAPMDIELGVQPPFEKRTIKELASHNVVPGHVVQVKMDGVGWLDADLLSEGTVLVLALITGLHMSTRPRIVLLDDIDRGLHPQAQAQFVERIRALQKEDSELQVIATTHSPYLLDSVEPAQVRVMGLRDGRAMCRPLTEHDEWPKWKGSLRAGEFWGSVGEAWVTA
jgi:hypothetical protein